MEKPQKITILKVADIAKMFNVHEVTVREWLRNGKIPAQKIGGQWFFELETIKKTFGPPINVYEPEQEGR